MKSSGALQSAPHPVPELAGLRSELRDAGLFNHCERASWLKLALLASALAGALVAWAVLPWWATAPAVLIAAVCSTSIAMLGHEGSHRSFSASPLRNHLLVYLTFPLFSGLSSLYWRHKHDRLHHGHPNVEGLDPDIRPWPFVASRGDHERSPRLTRWFQRYFQGWAFWPMSLLMSLGMRRASMIYLVQHARREGMTAAWWIEIGCMAGHYTAWVVIPTLVWGIAGFGAYVLLWSLVGVMLALIFAPAHLGMPVVREQNHDWVHQLETTRNLELPRVVSYFFIGLDYQVEHHLFPKIPHQHLPRAAAISRAWCERHGLPYTTVPYLAALADSARTIATAWNTDAHDPIEVRAGLVSGANHS